MKTSITAKGKVSRQKLVDSAINLFESKGYFSTTVEDIAVEAGFSKGMLYAHFNSKDSLLIELLEEPTRKMKVMLAAFKTQDGLDRSLEEFVKNYFNYLTHERQLLKIQMSTLLMPELRDITGKAREKNTDLMLSSISSLFQKYGSKKPELKARTFITILSGVELQYLNTAQPYPLSSLQPILMETLQGLCGSPVEQMAA